MVLSINICYCNSELFLLCFLFRRLTLYFVVLFSLHKPENIIFMLFFNELIIELHFTFL